MSMFRRSALRRVSSPEQLDSVVRTALPRQWVALVGLLAIVVAALCWAVIATVPTTLSGPGFLLPEGGLQQVDTPLSGNLATMSVQVGDHVVAGETIGSVTPGSNPNALGVPVDVSSATGAGVVTEVQASAGSFVTAGQTLALVQPAGWPLVVYTYLPVGEAAGLPVGLEARVTFAGGIGSAYGYAKGTVISVSRYPVSGARLRLVLQAGALVNKITAQGPSYEIVVQLDLSPTTPSGIAWGSGLGPPGALPPGLPATVQLLVGSHHPIDDVI